MKQQLNGLTSQVTSLASHLDIEPATSRVGDPDGGQAALQQRLRKIELTVAGLLLSYVICIYIKSLQACPHPQCCISGSHLWLRTPC